MTKKILLAIAFLLLSVPSWAFDCSTDTSTVACYLFATDGTKLNDSSGNGHTLSVDSDPTYGASSGVWDGAYTYDGNDHVTTADISSDVSPNLGTYTIFVKRISAAAWSNQILIYDNATDNIKSIERNDGRFAGAQDHDGSGTSFNPTVSDLTDSEWHHGALTWIEGGDDEGCVTFDGVFKAESCATWINPVFDSGTVEVFIGEGATGFNGFKGVIDEVGIFDDLKDNTDLNDIFDNGLVSAAVTRRIWMIN